MIEPIGPRAPTFNMPGPTLGIPHPSSRPSFDCGIGRVNKVSRKRKKEDKPKNKICKFCGEEGCVIKLNFLLGRNGLRYERVKAEGKCIDCGPEEAWMTKYHHRHCAYERCPKCDKQLLSCICMVGYVDINGRGIPFNPDLLPEWRKKG